MADFTVRQGDNFTIADTLLNALSAAVDIAAATVKFTMIPLAGGAAKISAATAQNLQVGDGGDGSKGKVSYTGGSTQSDTPGLYLGSWIVTFSGGNVQTYPNGGYVLIEVTADAPVAVVQRLAESIDLEARLGLVFTTDEHLRATKLLELASDVIRDECGQTITRVTADILTRRSVHDDRFRLPQRPVVSVASITIDGVTVDPATWYVDGDEVVLKTYLGLADSYFSDYGGGWQGPTHQLVVTYTHGSATVPAVVKTICLEAAVRVWVNPGAVIQERLADESTTYAPFTGSGQAVGLLLTDAEKRTLNDLFRRQAKSVQLR